MAKTKTIVIGESRQEETPKKSIVFTHKLLREDINKPTSSPHDFSYLELIAKDYLDGIDIIFAYSDPDRRSTGVLHYGQWNDGVV